MSAARGRFITLEGVEGAGKSTQLAFVRETLERAGLKVVVTREPGGTVLGEELRTLLLGHRDDDMCIDSELLLMFAARAEHLARVIRPALAEGRWVVSDRFTDATYAYQGGGRGVPDERIAVLERWVQQDLKPDLTLVFDVAVAVGLERAARRGDPDRFESEGAQFLERVRAHYRQIAEREPQRVRLIDSSRAPAAIQGELRGILGEWLP